MVPDELKEELSAESLEKYMHVGVLAYASASYMIDIMEELSNIEDEEKRDRLQGMCIERVVTDLMLGSEVGEDHVTDWARHVFRGAEERF